MSTDIVVVDAQNAYETSKPEVVAIYARAQGLQVTNGTEYEAAIEMARDVQTRIKNIGSLFAESKSATDKAHKAVCSLENMALKPLKDALGVLKTKGQDFLLIEKERQQKLQAKLAEEAKLNAAVEAESEGQGERSERILNGQENVPTPVAPVLAPKVTGAAAKKSWTYEIFDVEKIVRAFMIPDDRKIRDTVKVMGKDAEAVVGGIIVTETFDLAIQARKT